MLQAKVDDACRAAREGGTAGRKREREGEPAWVPAYPALSP
jgi:hypothetical protein